MEPTQKRCLLVSLTMHGVLLGALVIGAAFIKPPEPREIVPIKVFSGRLVDSIVNGGGGGSPAPRVVSPPTPTPPTPAPTPPAPAPTPPRPAPVDPPPAPRNNNHTAVVPDPTRQKTSKTKAPTETTSKKANPSFTLTSKSKTTDKAAKSPNTSQTTGKATNERLEAFNRTFKEIGQGLSADGLTISDVGVGGGPGAVNYSQAVLGAYDDAWNPPAELTEDVAIAVVRIVVHRTGRITDARIIKRSTNALMDRSVQNALEAVKSLPPFPEGAKDLERTFKIEFNLKVKRGIG